MTKRSSSSLTGERGGGRERGREGERDSVGEGGGGERMREAEWERGREGGRDRKGESDGERERVRGREGEME